MNFDDVSLQNNCCNQIYELFDRTVISAHFKYWKKKPVHCVMMCPSLDVGDTFPGFQSQGGYILHIHILHLYLTHRMKCMVM